MTRQEHRSTEFAESADPHFKPRKRVCNRHGCNVVFITTPLRRMFCSACYQLARRTKLIKRIVVKKISSKMGGSE